MAIQHSEHGKAIDLNTIEQTKSSTLIKHEAFEVIRLIVEPNKKIPPHSVAGPITVQCLVGDCDFYVDGDPQPMAPGSWLYLNGGTTHSVTASERSILLVTIIFT